MRDDRVVGMGLGAYAPVRKCLSRFNCGNTSREGRMMRNADLSPRGAARIAGWLYLVIVAGGVFAEMFVREPLVVAGNAVETARNVLAHEMLFRAGFVIHLFYLACAVPVAVILYSLFRATGRKLALLALSFDLVSIAMEGANLLNFIAPLRMLAIAKTGALDLQQAQELAYAHLVLFDSGFGISLVFFGAFCVSIGWLVAKSGQLPKALGTMMVLAGACYLVNSFCTFLAPELAGRLFPWILLPCFLGELALALWLATAGIRARSWDELAELARSVKPACQACAGRRSTRRSRCRGWSGRNSAARARRGSSTSP